MGTMLQTLLAALGAAVCVALLVHMFLPAAQRQRLDTALSGLRRGLQARWQARRVGKPVVKARAQGGSSTQPAALPGTAPRLPRQAGRPVRAGGAGSAGNALRPVPAAPPKPLAEPKLDAEAEHRAELEALALIERARRQARQDPPVERDGNVYRPDAFKPRPPKDRLH